MRLNNLQRDGFSDFSSYFKPSTIFINVFLLFKQKKVATILLDTRYQAEFQTGQFRLFALNFDIHITFYK